jgi:predicted ATPase/class 3 adenylate cyclase
VRDDLPTGTVTFLLTDVQGSTRLLYELGAERYAEALAEHRQVIREVCASSDGVEVDTQGDAFLFAFPTAPAALAAAADFTTALSSGPIRVRVGLHTGTPLLTEEGYVGEDVHRAARIAAAGHGGQVLVSSSTAPLVELKLVDLGEHRLKDLSAPERIYQLGDGAFPALKALYRTNLPVPATAFVGREQELAEVLSLLFSEETRLLTLTGPGGTGKTRLALQAVAEASDRYPDGVWWIPLAPLREPGLVLDTAAQVVGSKNGLAEHIQDKAMLCLFDNFEQVVEAGGDLTSLLASCPNLDFVVTSRERLRVSGEQTYPVPPLDAQDGEALFSARARAVDPSFAPSEAVTELCLRLDELPLALELAAARIAVFSPEQLLERLSVRLDLFKGERDADPRQRTLRATIEWSYDLLTQDEQRLFGRLAIFAGSCTYEAAEAVADADPDALQSLLDKSLVRKRGSGLGPRYSMLETIRDYAAERLEGSGEADELRRRRDECFVALAEDAEVPLRYDSREWLDRLEADYANLRAALDSLEAMGDTQAVLGMAGAIWRYWFLRGHPVEGRRRLESALAADRRPTPARARALIGATVLTFNLGDVPDARPWAEEALALHRELGDDWGTALALNGLGGQCVEEGDPGRAVPLLEEALERFRDLGDRNMALMTLSNLAWAHAELGERDRARELHADVLQRAREQHDERQEAHSLYELATFALDDGRLADASSMLRASLRIFSDRSEPLWIRNDLSVMAAALAREGRAEKAALLLAAAHALQNEMGSRSFVSLEERDEETIGSLRAQLGDAAFDKAWGEGAKLSRDEAVALALADPSDHGSSGHS